MTDRHSAAVERVIKALNEHQDRWLFNADGLEDGYRPYRGPHLTVWSKVDEWNDHPRVPTLDVEFDRTGRVRCYDHDLISGDEATWCDGAEIDVLDLIEEAWRGAFADNLETRLKP